MEGYQTLERIGSGSFGEIHTVKRVSDGKIFARKEIDYKKMTDKEKQQLVAEVNILRDLKHPNIVRYHERFVDRESYIIYIIMEYCEGGDLSAIIRRCRKESKYIAEEMIWNILAQLLLALYECHSASGRQVGRPAILHRDIKPENVFLDGYKNVKLGDFGLSRIIEDPETEYAKTYVGTPYYMSPELVTDTCYNTKSDIWALGCLIYELCTLSPPFQAKNQPALFQKIQSGRVAPLPPQRFSSELQNVINDMLTVNHLQRPSAQDLLSRYRSIKLSRREIEIRSKEKDIEEKVESLKAQDESLRRKEALLIEREKDLKLREVQLKERERAVAAQATAPTSIPSIAMQKSSSTTAASSLKHRHSIDTRMFVPSGHSSPNLLSSNPPSPSLASPPMSAYLRTDPDGDSIPSSPSLSGYIPQPSPRTNDIPMSRTSTSGSLKVAGSARMYDARADDEDPAGGSPPSTPTVVNGSVLRKPVLRRQTSLDTFSTYSSAMKGAAVTNGVNPTRLPPSTQSKQEALSKTPSKLPVPHPNNNSSTSSSGSDVCSSFGASDDRFGSNAGLFATMSSPGTGIFSSFKEIGSRMPIGSRGSKLLSRKQSTEMFSQGAVSPAGVLRDGATIAKGGLVGAAEYDSSGDKKDRNYHSTDMQLSP